MLTIMTENVISNITNQFPIPTTKQKEAHPRFGDAFDGFGLGPGEEIAEHDDVRIERHFLQAKWHQPQVVSSGGHVTAAQPRLHLGGLRRSGGWMMLCHLRLGSSFWVEVCLLAWVPFSLSVCLSINLSVC